LNKYQKPIFYVKSKELVIITSILLFLAIDISILIIVLNFFKSLSVGIALSINSFVIIAAFMNFKKIFPYFYSECGVYYSDRINDNYHIYYRMDDVRISFYKEELHNEFNPAYIEIFGIQINETWILGEQLFNAEELESDVYNNFVETKIKTKLISNKINNFN
jgi:hypothetical protein